LEIVHRAAPCRNAPVTFTLDLMEPSRRLSGLPLIKAVLFGILLALFAAALAEFVSDPALGHRMDASNWPAEARAILAERPLEPLSSEQFQRLRHVLTQHGRLPQGSDLFAASVRHSWYWFIVLPVAVLATLRRRVRLSLPTVASLVGPSLVLLAFGLVHKAALLQ
jgi:hypothetical protein